MSREQKRQQNDTSNTNLSYECMSYVLTVKMGKCLSACHANAYQIATSTILYIRKMRNREVKKFAQGHKATVE